MTAPTQWVVIADERLARLFLAQRTTSATPGWTLTERAALRNPHEDEHERGRPSILAQGPTSNAHHLASPKDKQGEERRRFSHEVAAWIAEHVAGHDAPVTVFAAPKLLGDLRQEQARNQKGPAAWSLKECELTRLAEADLARHPAVLAGLDPTRA